MIPQLELENRNVEGQNLRKEVINWTNPSKSRAQGMIPCIDSEISFDYIDSTMWYDSKKWNYINIKPSKTIRTIGGQN